MRALIGLVVLTALGRGVVAQPSDVVRTFQAGVDAFRLGKYVEARELLEKARAMDPKLPGPHRFLAAVAQAEQRWEDCVASARTAVALKPDSTEVAATRTIHDACRGGLARQSFLGDYGDGGAISVLANVDGATITIDGLRYGATQLSPRALAAGPVEVVIEKFGWITARVQTEVLPKLVTDVVVTLEPDPAATIQTTADGIDPTTHGWLVIGEAPVAAKASVVVDGKPVELAASIPLVGGVHEVSVEAPGRERWRRRVRITRGQKTRVAVELPTTGARAGTRRTALYVLAGAGVFALAGAGAGLISTRAAEDARDLWRIETTRPASVPIGETEGVEPVRTRDDLEDARAKARTWSYVSLASYGVAIVGAGVGAYLLLRSRSPEIDGEPAPFAIAPIVGPDGIGAAVTLQGALDW
jgi:hypothetical protein